MFWVRALVVEHVCHVIFQSFLAGSGLPPDLKKGLRRNPASPRFWTPRWCPKTRRCTISPTFKFTAPAQPFQGLKHVVIVIVTIITIVVVVVVVVGGGGGGIVVGSASRRRSSRTSNRSLRHLAAAAAAAYSAVQAAVRRSRSCRNGSRDGNRDAIANTSHASNYK